MSNRVRGARWALLLWGATVCGQGAAVAGQAPASKPAQSGTATGAAAPAVQSGAAVAGGDAAEGGAGQGGAAVPTLTVATRVVEISAVVKGKDGAVRDGMTRDDFVLKQDGKEEPIRYFSQGDELPLTLALLVDTSGSQRSFLGDEEEASDVFFDAMLTRPEDRALLVRFDTRVTLLRGLTSSAAALHLSLLGLGANGPDAAATLLNDAVYVVSRDVLAKEKGRKAMVILSDGGDNGSRRSITEAVEAAQRADVQVYAIVYSAHDLMTGVAGGPGVRPADADAGVAALERMAESTGGQVFTVTRGMALREIYRRIGQDLRLEYEVGYTPPADLEPNSYHKLELRAKDRKLSVQARKGFFARP